MKLLFDENLSRKLMVRLAELYPGSVHVTEVGLHERSDHEVWEYAKHGGFLLVSADSDFYELANDRGAARSGVAAPLDSSDEGCRGAPSARGYPNCGIRRGAGIGNSGIGPSDRISRTDHR